MLIVGLIPLLMSMASVPAAPQLSVREIAIYDGRSSGLFLDIEGACFRPDGTWIVADKLAFRLLALDPAGKATASAGRRGGGPGEFMGPGPVASCVDTVVAADLATPRVGVFSGRLWYRQSFTAPGPIFDLGFDNEGRLWIASYGKTITSILSWYDLQGHERRRIAPKHSTGHFFNDIFQFSAGTNGILALAYRTRNVIEIWGTDGAFVRSFSVPGLPDTSATHAIAIDAPPGTLDVPDASIFRDIAVDPHGRLFILGEGYSMHEQRDIYVCTMVGTLLSICTLPEKVSSIWFSPDGFLFAVTGERDVIRKYAIVNTRKGGP